MKQKTKKIKIWLFENIKKIDKLLIRLTRKKQKLSITDMKGEISPQFLQTFFFKKEIL